MVKHAWHTLRQQAGLPFTLWSQSFGFALVDCQINNGLEVGYLIGND
jgi:hypothetical protein